MLSKQKLSVQCCRGTPIQTLILVNDFMTANFTLLWRAALRRSLGGWVLGYQVDSLCGELRTAN